MPKYVLMDEWNNPSSVLEFSSDEEALKKAVDYMAEYPSDEHSYTAYEELYRVPDDETVDEEPESDPDEWTRVGTVSQTIYPRWYEECPEAPGKPHILADENGYRRFANAVLGRTVWGGGGGGVDVVDVCLRCGYVIGRSTWCQSSIHGGNPERDCVWVQQDENVLARAEDLARTDPEYLEDIANDFPGETLFFDHLL